MSDNLQRITNHWTQLTATRTGTQTLAHWASAPDLADACVSWDGLLCDIRTFEGVVANRLVRSAQAGDELAHLTVLVAVMLLLVRLVARRHRHGSHAELVDDAVSVAAAEILRPSLAEATDRVLFRIVSNVDWVMFRRPAGRDRIARHAPWTDSDDIATVIDGDPARGDLSPSEHVRRLVERAIADDAVAVGDLRLVARRYLAGDHTPLPGLPERTSRLHVQTAVTRFVRWAQIDADITPARHRAATAA